MDRLLSGKVAVVTGADLPLGRGLALALGRAGAAVAVVGDPRTLAGVVADLEAIDSRSVALALDGTSRATVESSFDEVVDALGGRVDVLVHSAMPSVAFEAIDFDAVDDARWDAVWEQTMRTTLFLLQAAFAQMKERGGRIILVTPTVSMSGAARLVPYTTTLEGQRILAKAAARQWGTAGITVNCLAPAPEQVPIGFEAASTSLATPALGTAGHVERDLGPVAVFLAGDGAHFLTGATLAPDGGVWMAP
jgi:NAD(P)-dependent dehydrogenase (short-subunit alcohol dehydrogenase family)